MEFFFKSFIYALFIYFLIGAFFGLYFIFGGVKKLDPGMHKVSFFTRLIIYPGSVCLWIILLFKLLKHDSTS